ncbi:MAG: ATP-dependent helicase HrpB [Fibrobacterota bacterium]
MNLPILDIRKSIFSALQSNNRLILHAPTGSGKSTQLPSFALEALGKEARVLVLQPRRVAAHMLAARVAEERNVPLGGEVGYQTRFDSAYDDDTRILFLTEGILPRRLLGDSRLSGVSAVVFDEFHERSLTTDLGLALVKSLQETSRPDLRIIVMSATLETDTLLRFLPGAELVTTQGRQHPVDVRYLPVPRETAPWDAAVMAARKLMSDPAGGDLLVFMPGAYEIRKTLEALKTARLPEPVTPLPLYGDLPWEQQRRAMAPGDRRKVIVATNIAETSLTIPGVRHVIDSGLARVNRFDAGRGFNTLAVETISRAAADQRAGRAGREGPGACIRLWDAGLHATRAPFTQPEINRVDLSEAVLSLKVLGIRDIVAFGWFEAPPPAALAAALELLHMLGALDVNEALTEQGRAMAALPAHPRLSRLLLECVHRGAPHAGAFAAALLSERPVSTGRADIPDRDSLSDAASDFDALAVIIKRAETAGFSLPACARFNINGAAARQVLRTQAYFLSILKRLRLPVRETGEERHALSKALLLSYPDRLARWRDNGTFQYVMQGDKSGELDRDSAARNAPLIIAADVRETRNRGQAAKTVLSLACGVEEEWLLELFPDAWQSENGPTWNTDRMCVEQRMRTWCLGVLVEEKTRPDVDPEKAAILLSEIIIEKNLLLEGFGDEAKAFMDRVRWLRTLFPEENLPAYNDQELQAIIREMCFGETRYSSVRNKPALPALRQLLGNKTRFVEEMAPAHIALPGGRHMPITYSPGQEPHGRTRIQDLYGMNTTPMIAGGRARLLIEITAPNNRPVQITNDLAGFWERVYPELKKQLSRRYPRHEWR